MKIRKAIYRVCLILGMFIRLYVTIIILLSEFLIVRSDNRESEEINVHITDNLGNRIIIPRVLLCNVYIIDSIL